MPNGDQGAQYPRNPLIEKLSQEGEGPLPSTVRLAGYLGGVVARKVRLHASLEKPSEYLEVDENDVLLSEDAPEDVLPGKGTYLWVKAETRIRCVRFEAAQVEARYLAGPIAEAHLRSHQGRLAWLPPPTWQCWPPPTHWCGAINPTWSCGLINLSNPTWSC